MQNFNTEKNKVRRLPKTLYEHFDQYSEDEINKAVSTLCVNHKSLLEKAYGQDLKDKTLYQYLTKNEKSNVSYIRKKILETLKTPEISPKKVKQHKKTTHHQDIGYTETLTKDSSVDLIRKVKYKKLSRDKEIKMIKKSQLSYYYDVDEELQIKYLNYYFEMFPDAKKRYERIKNLIQEKELLIKKEYPNLNATEKIEYLKALKKELNQLIETRDCLIEKLIEESKRHRDKFLENNVKLVASVAGQPKYKNKAPFDDLFVEGNIGMFKALSMFDIEKGYKFSTYATWWINKTIGRYLKKYERTVRIPVHIEEKISKINWATEEVKNCNQTPTPEKISKMTGFKISEVLRLLEIKKSFTFIYSLNTSIGEDEENVLESFIPSDEDLYMVAENEIYKAQLMKIIDESNLDSRTIYVLKLRYGIIDDTPKTLEEIATIIGLTRESVRRIEKKGIEFLRKNDRLVRFYNSQQDCIHKVKKR